MVRSGDTLGFKLKSENQLYVSGCRAKSFWLLARHGSRNPGDDDISQMEIRGPEIQAAILDNHQHGKGK